MTKQQTNPTKKSVQMGCYIEPWTYSCLNRRDGRTGTSNIYNLWLYFLFKKFLSSMSYVRSA